jgi:ABC-type multidrug transport system fused ATPase/permease subunit
MLRYLMMMIFPVGSLVGSAGLMLYLDARLSAIVFALGCAMGAVMHRINVAAAGASRVWERHGAALAGERRRLVRQALEVSTPLDHGDPALDEFFSRGAGRRYFDAFFRRHLMSVRTRLAVNVLLAVSMFALVFAAGRMLLAGSANWSGLVAYVAVLMMFVASLRHLSGILAQLSRLYPPIRRYVDFVRAAEAASGPEALRALAGPGYVAEASLDEDDEDDEDGD